MGENHARVYDDVPETALTGVFDVDRARAEQVADRYGTRAMGREELLDAVDVVSIAVPTAYHYDMAAACIRQGVHVLVEKPFVAEPEAGRELAALAAANDVTVQVGHVERFNPAVDVLRDVVEDLDVVSVTARRLGPPPDREIHDTAVMDLMIHDVDVVMDLVDGDLTACDAVGAAEGRYATGTLAFDSGVVGTLTASRVTPEKVRELTVSTLDCRVTVDYIDQTVAVHRVASPEVAADGGHGQGETLVERVPVDQGEPLKREVRSFAEAVTTGTEPVVPPADGLAVLEVTRALDRAAAETPTDGSVVDARTE